MKIKPFKQINKQVVAGGLFHTYIRLVGATGRIKINHIDRIQQNTMLGYWHGDSYCMQLVLKEVAKKRKRIQVIVTADKRGDAIEYMINHYDAKAIRLPDGLKMRPFFAQLKAESLSEGGILATALDGPLGPLHEPKKLLFLLALESDKEMTYVHFTYRRVLRIKRRWDNYVIPLPFSKITAEIEDLGKIEKSDLANFKEYQNRLVY
ncbi:hypothetical protein QA584_23200 [Anaerocolumna sp. AGMB13025]|uniref:hypothetical protein n=1 Tax=Anaerocolumna sp. AGMB13025 TaxID=3039116 RepID=UPI00241FF27C|nr:hypothetical protein [Anaerocolumna sp. AGMB13025]WFR56490.1 hypothetical protein QA584_23200 [Anaerocolumna sp. AGMB13025]